MIEVGVACKRQEPRTAPGTGPLSRGVPEAYPQGSSSDRKIDYLRIRTEYLRIDTANVVMLYVPDGSLLCFFQILKGGAERQ